MKELNLKRFLFRFRDLQKIGRQLKKLSEAYCNVGLTDKQQKREDNLIKKADLIAKEFDLRAYYQGDPRGLSLYLVTEEEYKGSNCDYTNGIPVY